LQIDTVTSGDNAMQFRRFKLRDVIFSLGGARANKLRRARQVAPSCDSLEGRVTPAHYGIAQHALAHLHTAEYHAHASLIDLTTAASNTTTVAGNTTTTRTSTTTTASDSTEDRDRSDSDTDSSSSSSSALSTARQTLQNDVQTIELASSTTVGQLTAIRASFQTLEIDGLSPSSESALKSFENSLVTTNASGTALTSNATLLSQFEALYTSSPTTQQTTDLTTAYNALAAAVTSANITSANITTINTDYAAVLAAEGSTSTATFPYFELVTGQGSDGEHDFGGGGDC
jgi:hypothetical protein